MANPGSLITTRAHGVDTYVDEYRRDGMNRLVVPRYQDLQGQVDFVVVQIYQGGYWEEFPQVWEPLASPCPMRLAYVYQKNLSWEKQASETLEHLPGDCQGVALDIEKIGNTLDKTFMADAGRILRFWKQERPKLKVMYYSNIDVYVNFILPIMLKNYPGDRWYLDFDLWCAQWPYLKTLRTPFNNPNLPATMRGDWKVLQYNDAGDKPKFGSLDLDVFNGPVEDMQKWLGIAEQIPPEPEPQPIPVPVPAPTPEPGDELWNAVFPGAWYRKMEVNGATCHLMMIDLTQFEIYFDPCVSVASTTSFLARNHCQIAINGLDGFYSTKRGRTILTQLAGFAASKGRQFGKLGNEQTLFVSKDKHFSLNRPAAGQIWDACSFPNLLVLNGILQPINKSPDDIRARTAFGVNGQFAYLLAIDGGDYWVKKGLNVQDTAKLMQSFCESAVLADSGGSTTMVVEGIDGKPQIVNRPCGENADGQRSVAIHMGFKARS